MTMEELMGTKVPVTCTVRGWEYVRFCRAVDLEEAILRIRSGDENGCVVQDPKNLLVALSSLVTRLNRSKNTNVVDELPFFSVNAAHRKAFGGSQECVASPV